MLYTVLHFVEKYIDEGKSLSDAFRDFAKQYGYTAKSVKKCFIAALQGFESHPLLAKKFGVDIKKLSDAANVFNMAAVKDFVISNGGNLDKSFFALCFGDQTEALALQKRFERFFPDFGMEKEKKQPQRLPPSDFPLVLQADYYGLSSTSTQNL